MKASSLVRQVYCRARSTVPDPMNLMAREGDARDIPAWHELHCAEGLPYSRKDWEMLPQLWEKLLGEERLALCLVADRARPRVARIVSCCAVVFVTDAFCLRMKERAIPPFFGIELARSCQTREPCVLTRAQIARANGERGLNVVICFEGGRQGLRSAPEVLAIREKQDLALRLALSGYQLKELLANPTSEELFQQMIDAGGRLRGAAAKSGRTGSGGGGKPARRRLVGLTREEAEAHPGSQLSSLFAHYRPRFRFSGAEQKLLQRALTGETREDLAASLVLSEWTIKRRWQSIYDRVSAVDGELLPEPIAYGPKAHARGMERRRRLLNYLRQHPEELRPSREVSAAVGVG